MDLQGIRNALTPEQQAAIDLDAAWRRYRGAGGLDDEAFFEAWLGEQYPELFDLHRTLVDAPVEVSLVMPARFGAVSGEARTLPDAAHTLADAEAPTVHTERSHPPATVPAKQSAPSTATEFHYEILGTAGKGGMGTVHIAKDTELLRRVALKELSPEADTSAGARTRFLREVQITAQLDHPNIVPVYALEIAPGGTPAYTMKFVEGRTFHSLLNEARDFFESGKQPDETRSVAARLEHFLKVCDAIAYAHDKGVIHRDLKPANLMLGRHNEVYVMDWGLCRVLRQFDEERKDAGQPEKSVVMSTPDISGSASETQIGDVVGTPKYMSPEQAQGRNRELDARSDQCALGLILFEMVTLNPPYDGRSAYEVLVNAAAGRRRPIVHAHLRRPIPRDLRAIIERATALSPDQRYADVAEMAADLRRCLRGEAVHAAPDNVWQRMQRAIARNRQRVLTGILSLIAVAAIAIGGLLWQNQRLFQAERLREQRLLALASAVADISDHVQMRFLQVEGGIENLADSVAQILIHGQLSEQRFYLQRDFGDPKTAPEDLQPSATHSGKVSLHWPAWIVSPDVPETQASNELRRLAVLQQFMREIYARSAHMIEGEDQDFYANSEHVLGNDNSPLNAVLIALDNGITARYPGWDGLPANYEARQRPWYTQAKDKQGPLWGVPYLNAVTGMLELPLSIPLYGPAKRFLGVVSAAFLPDMVVKSLFRNRGEAAIEAMYLLDREGRILAAAGNTIPIQTPAPDAPVTQIFPVEQLVRQIKDGRTGILETRLRDQPVVIAYDEVSPFGWSVVAVANPKTLFKATLSKPAGD